MEASSPVTLRDMLLPKRLRGELSATKTVLSLATE